MFISIMYIPLNIKKILISINKALIQLLEPKYEVTDS